MTARRGDIRDSLSACNSKVTPPITAEGIERYVSIAAWKRLRTESGCALSVISEPIVIIALF
jgi:hypothetical protein